MASRPTRVCLCGSTRFMEAFCAAGWALTLRRQIVLSVGVCKHSAHHGAEAIGQDVADGLDELHLRKIDLADWVLILNIGGYIGDSTRKEMEYANEIGKEVRMLTSYLLPDGIPDKAEWETWEEVSKLANAAANSL